MEEPAKNADVTVQITSASAPVVESPSRGRVRGSANQASAETEEAPDKLVSRSMSTRYSSKKIRSQKP